MSASRNPLVGRAAELGWLCDPQVSEDVAGIVVSGPSGIGKTKLVEVFCESSYVKEHYDQMIFCSLYRTTWTSALAHLKKGFPSIPANATQDELETSILALADLHRILLVLDNVDEYNHADVTTFVAKWSQRRRNSLLVITAQPDIRAVLPQELHDLRLEGLRDDDDVLALLGDLQTTLPVTDLLEAGQALDGNPQLLLFMQWLEPQNVASLKQLSGKLADRNLAQAVEDLVSQSSLPTLFFLALGVHKDTNVSQRLLAALWDHFGSRGAEPFIRSIQTLVDRGFLTPTTPGAYRLHESVHVSLPKALRHRVGDDRVPSLHHYFAEYYRRGLHHSPTSTAFTRFIYHARLATNYSLIYDTLIEDKIVDRLASAGMVLQARTEIESLEPTFSSDVLGPGQLIALYLALGRLCNALSEHRQALKWMGMCDNLLATESLGEATQHWKRDIWYIKAVAYSNIGRSDSCLRNYFQIVASCADDADPLACLSLGYLAHDLKHRDLSEADRIGALSVTWARSFDSGIVLAKNLCSHAQTLTLAGQLVVADHMFREAKGIAEAQRNQRELGRILTNWGFAEMLSGNPCDLEMIAEGTALSKKFGDRRRHLQGILYQGVALARRGSRARARAHIFEAAQGFRMLNDGRHFTPALLWLLQVDGHDLPNLWPADQPRELRPDTRLLVDHVRDYPEYDVYTTFWHRYLSRCVMGRQ